MSSDTAALILMALIMATLIAAWISLKSRPSKVYEEYMADEKFSPYLEARPAAGKRIMVQQSSPQQAASNTMRTTAMTSLKSPQKPASITIQTHKQSERAQKQGQEQERTERLAPSEDKGQQQSNEDKVEVNEPQGEAMPEDEVDIEEVKLMLAELKKDFATLLEEYERLRQHID